MSGVGKAFCAGGDIMALYKAGIKEPGSDPTVLAEFPALEYLLDYALKTMKPTEIALWNGVVMGGGVGLSNHAPFRIATDTTVYAMPETGIGFFTDVAGSYFLPRMKNNICLGMFLGLTGHRLKAKDLLTWGVATHYVPQTNLEEMKKELFGSIKQTTTDTEIEAIINTYAEQDSGQIANLDEIN